MHQRRLAVTFLISVMSELLNRLFPFIVIHHVQASLGAEGFGRTQFALALMEILSVLVVFGYQTAASLRIGRSPEDAKKVFSLAVVLKGFHAFSVILLLGIGITLFEPLQARLGVILAPAFLLLTVVCDVSYMYYARQQLSWFNGILTLTKLVSLLLIVTLIQSPDQVIFCTALLASANGLANLVTLVHQKRHLAFDWPTGGELRRFLREALPHGIPLTFLTFGDRLDMLMTELLLGSDQSGLYAGPYRVTMSFVVLVPQLAGAFYSELFALKERDQIRAVTQLCIWVLFAITIPLAIGAWFVGGDLLAFILDDSYRQVAHVFSVQMIYPLLFAITWTYGFQLLVISGMVHRLNWSLIAGVVLAGGGIWLVAPHFGLIGIAWVGVVAKSFVAALVLGLGWSRASFRVTELVRSILLPAGIMAIAMGVTRDQNLWIQIANGSIVYGIALTLMNQQRLRSIVQQVQAKRAGGR